MCVKQKISFNSDLTKLGHGIYWVYLWFWFVFRLNTFKFGIFSKRCFCIQDLSFIFYFRDFVKAFIQFKKPIVVAINGPALGLGASILPLCDIVWASEKAWFQTPYATIRLTPAGCSSYTFPQILGVALVRFSTSYCWRTFVQFMLFLLSLKCKPENNFLCTVINGDVTHGKFI